MDKTREPAKDLFIKKKKQPTWGSLKIRGTFWGSHHRDYISLVVVPLWIEEV